MGFHLIINKNNKKTSIYFIVSFLYVFLLYKDQKYVIFLALLYFKIRRSLSTSELFCEEFNSYKSLIKSYYLLNFNKKLLFTGFFYVFYCSLLFINVARLLVCGTNKFIDNKKRKKK